MNERWKKHRLGSLLIAVGLLFLAWPAAIWLYGAYEQAQLARQFALTEKAVARSRTAQKVTNLSVREKATRTRGREEVTKPPMVAANYAKPLTAVVPPPAKSATDPKTKKKTPSPRRIVKPGEPIARLRIPRIDVNVITIEGDTRSILRKGAGHLPGTGFPGENRNCAIAAHRAYWFRRVPDLHKGDVVWLDTPDTVYKYVVENQVMVTPDRSDLLNRGRQPYLTLITCDEPSANAPYRILVFCRLKGSFPR